MTSILISQDFRVGYWDALYGTANQEIKLDGVLVNLKSPLGINNGAMKQYFFPISPGDELLFEVFARKLKGEASISIDLFEEDGTFTSAFFYQSVISPDFQNYKNKIKIPYGKKYTHAGIVIGITNSVYEESEAEFLPPRLSINGAAGVLQTIAAGVIQIESGGNAKLNEWYKRVGVKSVEYNNTTKRIKVFLDKYIRFRFYPIITANVHIDRPNYHAVVGTWDVETNSFELGVADSSGLVSLSTGGPYNVHFEVKA